MAKTRRDSNKKAKGGHGHDTQTKLFAFSSQSRTTLDEDDAAEPPNLDAATGSTVREKRPPESPQTLGLRDGPDVEEVASPPGIYDMPSLNSNILESETPSARKLKSIFDLPVPILPEGSRVKHPEAKNGKQDLGPLDRHFGPSRSARLQSRINIPLPSSSSIRNQSVIVPEDSLLQERGSSSFKSVHQQDVLNTPVNRPASAYIRAPSIIVIDETPPRPTKETHSFFQLKRKAPMLVIEVDSDGDSIVSLGERHSISPASPRKSIQLAAPWPDADLQHVRPPLDAFPPSPSYPFPNKPQSSRLPFSALPASPSPLPWYECLQNPPPLESNSRMQIPLRQSKPILQEHTHHPALLRLQSSSFLSQSPLASQGSYHQEQWIDKYRPTRASEVLGNDINARYIKEWLSALQLDMDSQSPESETIKPATFSSTSQKGKSRGTKRSRPVIVRTVDKPKKKRRKEKGGHSAQNWIVNSDDEDEIYEEMSPDDVASSDLESRATSEGINLDVDDNPSNSRASPSQVPTSSLHQFDFSARLTNALLIAGPPGTGKTSAVYACAAELGWSVFEANPGSGKRTGALLSGIFDGVGKNHTLSLGPRVPNAGKEKQSHQSGGLGTFFGARREPRKNIPPSDVGTVADPIDLDSDDSSSRSKRTALGISEAFHSKESGPRNINQSIILLEEVDILFQNEGGFWPAVINLIKESHRPVIMTCNDVSLVPVQELPLQTMLGFEPCPTPLAASYLGRLSQLEGCEIEQSVLEQLYEAAQDRLLVDFPDQPMHPVPTHSNPVPDLRHAIQQTQILCPTAKPPIIEACNPHPFEKLADWTNSSPVSLSDPDPVVTRLRETGAADDAITLQFLWKFVDSVSYANCVDRRLDDYVEAQLIDDYDVWDDGGLEHNNTHKASLDNLLGHTILHKPAPRETAPTVPLYARDEEIALEIVRTAHRRGALYPWATCSQQDSLSTSSRFFDSIRLFDDRAQHQSRVLKFIEGLVQLSSPLLPRAEIFVDYVPYVRRMVLADDAEKEAEAQALAALEESARAKGNTARMTRNSQRSAEGTSKLAKRHDFVRYISLKDDELRALYESAFSNF